MIRFPMTVAGEAALQAELKELKTVKRPAVITAIADAREHGDLKENAEYHAAREQQGFIEGRIQELEAKLSNSQVIDVTQIENTGKVIFGATVRLLNLDTDDEVTYRLVGEDEADVKIGLLNCTAPLAKAMLGKEEGDEFTLTTPNGQVVYSIEQVQYI